MKLLFLLPLLWVSLFGCEKERDNFVYVTVPKVKESAKDPEKNPELAYDLNSAVSPMAACTLRWPGEFFTQASEFCLARGEAASGADLDAILYPNVRTVTTEAEFIAAISEEVLYKRILLNESIVLKTKIALVGAAVIEGPGTLTFKNPGELSLKNHNEAPPRVSCNFGDEWGYNSEQFRINKKLRIVAPTQNLKITGDPYANDHIVLEGEMTGYIQISSQSAFVVVINKTLTYNKEIGIGLLVAINSRVKSNFNRTRPAKTFTRSLAFNSSLLDVSTGPLDDEGCWNSATALKTQSKRMIWDPESPLEARLRWEGHCNPWEDITEKWASCGSGGPSLPPEPN